MTSKFKQSLLLYSLVAFSLSATTVNSFHTPGNKQPHDAFFTTTGAVSTDNKYFLVSNSKTRLYSDPTKGKNGKTKFGQKTDADVSRFLTDFRTADGNVVDPYKMLQIKRSATKLEIKQSYRSLSRKLHPDMVAQTDVWPGRCQNMDDVRDEWERVKFSYEILSDDKTRKNYDRNSSVAEVLQDPGGAVGRAVVGGAMGGIGLVLGGAWKLGEMATKKVYETAAKERKGPPSSPSSSSSKAEKITTPNGTAGGDSISDKSTSMWETTDATIAASSTKAPVTKSNTNNFGPVESATETYGPIGVVNKKGDDADADADADAATETNTINLLTPKSNTQASTATTATKKKTKSKQKGVGKGFAKQ